MDTILKPTKKKKKQKEPTHGGRDFILRLRDQDLSPHTAISIIVGYCEIPQLTKKVAKTNKIKSRENQTDTKLITDLASKKNHGKIMVFSGPNLVNSNNRSKK